MTVRAEKQPRLLRDQNPWKRDWKENWILYLLFLPVLAYFVIFHYIPMSGIFMAFEEYKVTKGLFGSEWVGFEKFVELFEDEQFWLALRNSGAMALFNLTLGFVAPIILALLITSIKPSRGTRVLQTITYLPNFVSAVVVCSLASQFLDLNGGITRLLTALGFEQQNWLANGDVPVFWLINTGIGIWQGAGWGSIIYIAAIYNINGDLHEAAAIDGANRWQRLTHITLPGILPMIMMMLTLKIGLVFREGFDKVLLLYMPLTYETSDCLHTYTYRMAFGGVPDYSLSTASGLFQSVIATILLVISNWTNKKATGYALY
ncbi:MAG: sugar ABC transporter permease [Clostridia bacterium]|nr:sugar ABC transporter permease [Clostridia bacterium]